MTRATRKLFSRRNLIVAGFAVIVALISGYGQFTLGYLAHRTWYDDGVYMGAATRLGHGVVPYRDFVFLHPPGILVLLTPFALVGRVVGTAAANEAARLFVMAAAVAAVFLFAGVVRVRPDLALAVGLAVFVLHPDVIVSDQAVYLEPLLIVACLLGTALVFDGEELAAAHARWWWGGAVFGFACGLKLWAAFPILAIVLIAAVMRRWADAARLALASAAVFSLVCLPFLLFAPSAFVRYVLVVQASRTDPASATLTSRVGNLLYLPSRLLYLDSSIAENRGIVAVAVLLALSVVAWSIVRTRRRPLTALEWYSFVCAGLVVAAFLLAGDYFAHYGAFAALFFGLVASGTIARLLSGDTTAKARENERRFAPVAITAGLLVAVALLVAYDVHIVRVTTPDQKLSASALARIADVVPSGSCVVTDNASVLLMSGRFTADRSDCPQAVDSFGTELALTNGRLDRVRETEKLQQTWRSWLEHADFLVLNEPDLGRAAESDGWDQRVRRYADGELLAGGSTRSGVDLPTRRPRLGAVIGRQRRTRMPIDSEQQARATAWLETKGALGRCPACGKKKMWSFLDVIEVAPVRAGRSNGRHGGVPMLQVACTNCAYIQLFGAAPMGLV